MPQFLFLMKLTTTSDKTDSHKIITLQKSKHGKGNHVTLGYFSCIKLWGRKVLQIQFRIFYPCQFMKYFTYNILCTSNLPKSNEELESSYVSRKLFSMTFQLQKIALHQF